MLALLIDIGSTYTKLIAVDLKAEEVVGRVEALTTVDSDVTIGMRQALDDLKFRRKLDISDFKVKFACSSAAGGLRMVAVGLVPDLTAEAAKRAALCAGAKVIDVYAYKLTESEVEKIYRASPDIILLAGGTDGGEEETILHNAAAIADSEIRCPILIAGNKAVSPKAAEILSSNRKSNLTVENVLPELDKLNVEPTREAIQKTFIRHIIESKGIAKAKTMVDDPPIPTPSAVLNAAELIADGTSAEAGVGDLMVVDVGGATTDVHSVASDLTYEIAESIATKIIKRGIPEPRTKRSVEGDLGLRINALSILNSVGIESFLRKLRLQVESNPADAEKIKKYLYQVSKDVGRKPQSRFEHLIDATLAAVAIELALERHAGRFENLNTPNGKFLVQVGKDVSKIRYLIATGGVFAHNSSADKRLLQSLLEEADKVDPFSLRPKDPKLIIDEKYVIWAMGLLAKAEPNIALRMVKRELKFEAGEAGEKTKR